MTSSGIAAEVMLGPGLDLDFELVPEFVASAAHGRAELEFVHKFGIEAESV